MNLDDIMLKVVDSCMVGGWMEEYCGDVMKSGGTGVMVGGERVK